MENDIVKCQRKRTDTPPKLLQDVLDNHYHEYSEEEIAAIKSYLHTHSLLLDVQREKYELSETYDDVKHAYTIEPLREFKKKQNELVKKEEQLFLRVKNMETSEPIKSILEQRRREYRIAMEQKGEEAMAAVREKNMEVVREIMARTQEARRKNIEKHLEPEKEILSRIKVSHSVLSNQPSVSHPINSNSIEKVQESNARTKPSVLKAIITSILTLFVFYASYLASYLIIGGLIYVLSMIPIIGRYIDWLFYLREDTPNMMLSLLCPAISYYISMATQAALNKNKPTKGLSLILLGVYIVLLHIVSIPINLFFGNGILKNIIQAIVGFLILSSGISEIKESKET